MFAYSYTVVFIFLRISFVASLVHKGSWSDNCCKLTISPCVSRRVRAIWDSCWVSPQAGRDSWRRRFYFPKLLLSCREKARDAEALVLKAENRLAASEVSTSDLRHIQREHRGFASTVDIPMISAGGNDVHLSFHDGNLTRRFASRPLSMKLPPDPRMSTTMWISRLIKAILRMAFSESCILKCNEIR